MAAALKWLSAFAFLLVCTQAEQPSCSSESCIPKASSARTQTDTVSLLQSRGIHVEHADDTGSSAEHGSVAPAVTPAKARFSALLLQQTLLVQMCVRRLGSGWSMFLVAALMLMLCWCMCAAIGYSRMQRKEDLLEHRVTSVLQPQKAREDRIQPPEASPTGLYPAGAAGASPQMSAMSPFSNRLSPMAGILAPRQVATAPVASSPDMPLPLSADSAPLFSEARMQVAKDALLAAAKGGDVLLTGSAGAPQMRATVRMVDGDSWLEISTSEAGASPSAMTRITNKDAPAGLSFFGPKKRWSPELYGPDGSFYGTVETTSTGSQLISSTTAQPVLTISGDVRSSQLTVRTRSGLELATVEGAQGGRNINISLHKGAELALIVSTILTIILAN